MATPIREQEVNVNEVSRVSTGTVIKGEISSPNDIRIDGTFEGKVFSQGRVVIGEKAVVTGDIIGTNVDFWGRMRGNFYVKDTLSLKSSCSVEGDLHIKRLQVDLDAKFNGICKMINDQDFAKLTENLTPRQAPRPVVPNPAQAAPAQQAAPAARPMGTPVKTL